MRIVLLVVLGLFAPSAHAAMAASGQASLGGVRISTGNGIADAGTQRVAVSSDSLVAVHFSSVPTVEIQEGSTVTVQRIEAAEARGGRYYIVATDFVAIAGTAETPLLLVVNLSTNTVSAHMSKIRFLGAVSSSVKFRVYRNPVVFSSGTALGIDPGLQGSPASKMQAYFSPTVSNKGSYLFPGISSSSADEIETNGTRISGPGNVTLVTVQPTIGGSDCAAHMEWIER